MCRIVCFLMLLLTAQVASADLLAYYPFDGDATDQGGEGADGFIEGSVEYAGDGSGYDGVGGAFEFGVDGEPGNVVIPWEIGPEFYPELSVTMWVKADESIITEEKQLELGHHPKVFGHDDGGWDRSFGLDNRITCCGPEDFRWAAFTGGAGPGPTPAIEDAPVTSDWTFLAATWDAENESLTFTVNDKSITAAYTPTPSGFFETSIGSLRPDNFNEPFTGLIDEVRLFDTVLTAEEIADIRGPLTVEPVGCVVPEGGIAGDFDGDGSVQFADFLILSANFGQAVSEYEAGDVDCSGDVQFADFLVLSANFGQSAGAEAASVPEPSSLGLMVFGLLGLMVRRRRS